MGDVQVELDSEYDQIKSSGEASSLDGKEALLMYRRIEGTEKSVTGLTGKVESIVSQLERIERAKSKRRETMSKLLENITEVRLMLNSHRRRDATRLDCRVESRWRRRYILNLQLAHDNCLRVRSQSHR